MTNEKLRSIQREVSRLEGTQLREIGEGAGAREDKNSRETGSGLNKRNSLNALVLLWLSRLSS